MEPAKIDWNTINSIFVEDELYEHINAPQWIDFSAPHDSVDDESWFCRPDCNHPKRVEDFLKETSKLQRSVSVSEIPPLGDRNRRDANLKRRGVTPTSIPSKQDSKFAEDGENQNPNISTPSRQYNAMKAAIKSSTTKKETENLLKMEERGTTPRLRSTQSARNLFGGRDILNQITEFCSELKRMAMRAKEREEDAERLNAKNSPMAVKKGGDCLGDLDEREKERKPLLVRKEKWEVKEKSNVKEKQLRKK